MSIIEFSLSEVDTVRISHIKVEKIRFVSEIINQILVFLFCLSRKSLYLATKRILSIKNLQFWLQIQINFY